MRKAFKSLSIIAIILSVIGSSPLSILALENDMQTTDEQKKEVGSEKAFTDIVTSQNLGNQAWLIGEVNNQLFPKKVGVDLTFDDLSKITKIVLVEKGMSGEVPPEIKNLVSLQTLLLYSNNLTGRIPSELGELKNLTELRLDYNQLSGTIPDGLGNIASISLQNNKLVGQLPLSLYENRVGENEVNVAGNQVTLNSKQEIPSVFTAYTFVYNEGYSNSGGQIKAINTFLSNLTNDMSFTPFSPGSSTFIDLKVINMFDSALFAGHHVTIKDTINDKKLYDGELNSDVSIPLTNLSSGIHVLSIVLDNATQNPHNQVTILIDILPVAAEDLTVKYIDETGAEIHESQTISGNIGDYFDVTTPEYKLEIDKYELDSSKLPTNGIGTLNQEAQTVTYVYNKVDDGAPVTVKYVDKDGRELSLSDTLSGKIDDPYKTEAKDIAGFTLDENNLPANANGKFESNEQTVTYVYKEVAASIQAHDSTIYVGDKWNAKDNFDVALDNFGKSVSFSDVSVEGSVDTAKVGVYPVTYTFDGESVTVNVTVKSKAIPEPPVTPTKPVTPAKPNNPTTTPTKPSSTEKANTLKVTSTKHEQSTVASKLKLPTTGDNLWDSIMYSVFGLIVVCVGFSLLFLRKKQH